MKYLEKNFFLKIGFVYYYDLLVRLYKYLICSNQLNVKFRISILILINMIFNSSDFISSNKYYCFQTSRSRNLIMMLRLSRQSFKRSVSLNFVVGIRKASW